MKLPWERMAAIAICLAALGAGLWLGGRLLLSLVAPFLLAWLLSLCVTPLAERVSARLPISKRLSAAVLFTLLLCLLCLLVGFSVNRLLRELRELAERLLAKQTWEMVLFSEPFDYFARVTASMGLLSPDSAERYAFLRDRFNDTVSTFLEQLLSRLSSTLPTLAAKWIASLPSLMLFVAVTVIAGFTFCMDRERVEGAILSLLPSSLAARVGRWRASARGVLRRYLRAYLLLLLLTFGELFLGFCILRVDYAFLLAFVIAAVDFLPLLGVGTVLLPWALVAFLQRNLFLGVGLVILYVVVAVCRQIAEPRLIGKSLGLHPLLTLFAGYVGWKCFGVLGMALGPLVALVIKSLWGEKEKTLGEGGPS